MTPDEIRSRDAIVLRAQAAQLRFMANALASSGTSPIFAATASEMLRHDAVSNELAADLLAKARADKGGI